MVSGISKSKTYWDSPSGTPDPFSVPKRISSKLADCARHFENGPSNAPPTVKYLWIYVTEEGLARRRSAANCASGLSEEDWLNIIDESCSLGAEWMIIYVGACLSEYPEVWHMCDWAQREYGMRVGLHLRGDCLQALELEYLSKLDSEKTYIVADKSDAMVLDPLRERGINVCIANVRELNDAQSCQSPEDIACVGIDGELFTCGLVLGDDQFKLGNVQGNRLQTVMEDKNLPHAVSDSHNHHDGGCDGCPPHIARRVVESLPK